MSRGKRSTGYTRLSTKHQVTIPIGVVTASGAQVGTEFRVSAQPQGRIVLEPVDDIRTRRLDALDTVAGTIAGVWHPGDLEHLRDEWQ